MARASRKLAMAHLAQHEAERLQGSARSSRTAASAARCASFSRAGCPGALRSIRPSRPCALNLTTQSRTTCNPTPPILAASVRPAPSKSRQGPAVVVALTDHLSIASHSCGVKRARGVEPDGRAMRCRSRYPFAYPWKILPESSAVPLPAKSLISMVGAQGLEPWTR